MRRWRTTFVEWLSLYRRWSAYVIVGAAVFIVCLLLFSPILSVREIRVVRTEGRVDLRTVLAVLEPLYDRHIFFLSAHDVSTRVRSVVPDASDVTVSKRYPSELLIHITVVPLIARIVIDPPLTAHAGPETDVASGSGAVAGVERSYFLAENGLLVSTARASSPQALPTIRIVDWSVRPVPQAPLLTHEILDRLRRAENALTLEFGQQIRMRSVFLRAREFHLDTSTVSFWFDIRTPLEDQLQRLRTFLKNVKLQDVKSYADLRLIGRVVYK